MAEPERSSNARQPDAISIASEGMNMVDENRIKGCAKNMGGRVQEAAAA